MCTIYITCNCAGTELAVFGNIVRQLLGDAQKRIVFRAQVGDVLDVYTCSNDISITETCFRKTHNNIATEIKTIDKTHPKQLFFKTNDIYIIYSIKLYTYLYDIMSGHSQMEF